MTRPPLRAALAGVRDTVPLMIGTLPFGIIYGATAVFLALEFDARERKRLVADIEEGFSPVCLGPREAPETSLAA